MDGRIDVRNLSKSFGTFRAVDDLSFSVEPGRITGFLGPNGAGKTTTLRMVLGLIKPTSGTATIGGTPYTQLTHPISTVGAALEATNFHPGRTGRDHLRVIASAAGLPDSRADELLTLVGIPAAARKRAGGYSMGMRQRLGLAAALMGDPKVLILDEPANGLDPEGIRWLRGFLRHLASEGKTILISSHLLAEVEQTVDDVIIIANGRAVRQGTIDELRGEKRVRVLSPQSDRLARALSDAGLQVRPAEGGGLSVIADETAQIGEIAYRAGVPVHELHSERADLEQLFFQLTENTNRNLGDPAQGFAAPQEGGR
ncbi:ABC transporter ATP-binding protein [Calidifontibacter sp. DB0510]|uniref:ABC transporter ATP-binding protein n=1 Tax=Metallococcus carri TaxID=1656884 RepID=A0A967EHI1_9MICO|nr:ABC transporter ATP-binding protein [Metallococcus carri]NHN56403.1 ABC transporter ATP-binding protein [Metallococcus carri]NOP36027.1 ABC transporter ATP-binding protein [Calidifontibacter sp. DB2511S]